MRTLPDAIAIKFQDEKTWRNGVATIIKSHPNSFLNLAGSFEVIVPKSLESWARGHLEGASFDVLVSSDKGAPDKGSVALWNNRGAGVSKNFDDPKWLEKEAERLEEDNARRRKEIFQ